MEESNFMMALLIPEPSSPSKDFDIFMEPRRRAATTLEGCMGN
jgi:hypothetical protein